jgi:hypothetical protein
MVNRLQLASARRPIAPLATTNPDLVSDEDSRHHLPKQHLGSQHHAKDV